MNTKIVLSSLLALSLSSLVSAGNEQPNIVLILVDDMGYSDFGCYGNTVHKTPNIDFLAERGVKFTDFHSNGVVSSPTRASILTGRYPQFSGIDGVVGVARGERMGLEPGCQVLSQLLKNQGYATAIFGKWHLGSWDNQNPLNFGFDTFRGFTGSGVDYYKHTSPRGEMDWWNGSKLQNEKGYSTELLCDYAVDYIKSSGKKPFFLYLPLPMGHTELMHPYDETNSKGLRNNQIYNLMVEHLDKRVGDITKAIKNKGITDNTMVILLSDNGPHRFADSAPYSGRKSQMLEGGHRVPCIVYMPGVIKKPKTETQTWLSMDIFATICEVSAAKVTEKIDGVSFYDALTSDYKLESRAVFWKMKNEMAARYGDWKLIVNKDENSEKLFNLAEDITEQNNVINANESIASKLRADLENWLQEFAHIPQLSAPTPGGRPGQGQNSRQGPNANRQNNLRNAS